MSDRKSDLHIGRAELAVLKASWKEDFVKNLADVVIRFVRFAKKEDASRTYVGGSISKTYPVGELKVKLSTWRVGAGQGIATVDLTINGLRGSEKFDLEEFIAKGEAFILETTLLKEE